MLQQSLVVRPSGLESLCTWLDEAFQESPLTELATYALLLSGQGFPY